MGSEKGRGKLEVTRDILVILTCLMVIALVAVAGLLVMRYGPDLYKGFSSVKGVIDKLAPPSSSGGGSTEFISTGVSADLCKDLLAAQAAIVDGDSDTASAKLDSARRTASSKGLTKVTKLIDDSKKAAAAGDTLSVLAARNALNAELGCE